jgi:hypothetical protein
MGEPRPHRASRRSPLARRARGRGHDSHEGHTPDAFGRGKLAERLTAVCRPIDDPPVLAEAQYARSGDVHIAYQVMGSGPIDLVVVPGFVSQVEASPREPEGARFLRGLSSFSRLITFDKRSTGLSDRVTGRAAPSLDERVDDVRAVLDAVRSERAALLGVSEGAGLAVFFGATFLSGRRRSCSAGAARCCDVPSAAV